MFKSHFLINRKVTKTISFENSRKLEKFMRMYEDRYFGRLVCLARKPERLLGQNGYVFLLCSLSRSRGLFSGMLDSMNQSNLALAFLAVRAHFETTGSVAYFFRYLQKFYGGEITYTQMDHVLRRLSLGGKEFPAEKKNDPHWVDAINVLTMIDEADRLFNEMAKGKVNIFRESYNFLSEFCHPNLFGLRIFTDLNNSKVPPQEYFYKTSEFKRKDPTSLLSHLNISCNFFFPIYDKCFSLIKEREETPDLFKT